jgi:hypothetical protein
MHDSRQDWAAHEGRGMLVLCTLEMASARWQNSHKMIHYLHTFLMLQCLSLPLSVFKPVGTMSHGRWLTISASGFAASNSFRLVKITLSDFNSIASAGSHQHRFLKAHIRNHDSRLMHMLKYIGVVLMSTVY